MAQINPHRLLEDLKQVIHDAEELLKATAGQAGDHVDAARAKAEASLRAAREQITATASSAAEQAREAAGCADSYVRTNPWIAVGAGAAAGLLIGLVLGRRRGGGSR